MTERSEPFPDILAISKARRGMSTNAIGFGKESVRRSVSLKEMNVLVLVPHLIPSLAQCKLLKEILLSANQTLMKQKI